MSLEIPCKVLILSLIVVFSCASLSAQGNNQKNTCVLYGTCQMQCIYEYLKNHHPDLYDYTYVLSYRVIQKEESLEEELLTQADLFLYQPAKDTHGKLGTKYIVQHLLKSSCASISLPYVYFLGYFPDFVKSGGIPSFFDCLNREFLQGIPHEQIIQNSKADDFLSSEDVLKQLAFSLSELKKREKHTDIKISDFIEENYTKHRLFHTQNHPSNYLLKELCKRVLARLGLPIDAVDDDPMFHQELLQGHLPIYPCTYKYLQLQFALDDQYDDIIQTMLSHPKQLKPL